MAQGANFTFNSKPRGLGPDKCWGFPGNGVFEDPGGNPRTRDLSRDNWIKEFIKRTRSFGLFLAVGNAEKKKGLGRL